MKERPILFSGEMVRAILNGRKCQTRRVIKGVKPVYTFAGMHPQTTIAWFDDGGGKRVAWPKCPYGRPGDKLWVREACYLPGSGYFDDAGEWRPERFTDINLVKYAATDEPVNRGWTNEPYRHCLVKKPSIFMPRWASRITLEVTAVRVERVQDINHNDAQAEGLPCYHDNHECALDHFKELWNEVNGKRGHLWADNPWVWVVEFRQAA